MQQSRWRVIPLRRCFLRKLLHAAMRQHVLCAVDIHIVFLYISCSCDRGRKLSHQTNSAKKASEKKCCFLSRHWSHTMKLFNSYGGEIIVLILSCIYRIVRPITWKLYWERSSAHQSTGFRFSWNATWWRLFCGIDGGFLFYCVRTSDTFTSSSPFYWRPFLTRTNRNK